MSGSRRDSWDERYAAGEKKPLVDAFLTDNRHLLPKRGRALDLACGLGANAIFLAGCGLEVEGWDYSAVALDKLQNEARREGVAVVTRVWDVTDNGWHTDCFDIITVSRFLERSLTKAMIQALKPGGLLFYQTFVKLRLEDKGPKDPAFRLGKNELLGLFVPPLELVFYKEEWDIGAGAASGRDRAFLIARRPD